jgi:Uma2 family endonuclease
MSTEIATYYDLVDQMPADTVVTFHDVGWDEYEELLEQVPEASGLRISYSDGTMQVMTLSPEHENYTRFLECLMAAIRLRLRINIRSFGSATMRKQKKRKGNEPDACFYVQTAALIGNRMRLDFESDPPPDIAVEIDIHHDSASKFPIYAGLGVPEIWRYDEQKLSIYYLEDEDYVEQGASRALPLLTSEILTRFLNRFPTDGETETLVAFDEWLSSIGPH